MNELIGKWQQPEGERYPGLYFEFFADGKFRAVFEELAITSSGTYTAAEGLIDMDQTQHSMGILGKFEGRYLIKGDTLTMALSDPFHARPESLEHKNKRHYKKVVE
ncbi:MAG: hypothetical protein RBS68_00140 [Anaerolineales bacterium]|jgi:hypothetical protein|nr:hypothetical protein [Anaerolineales bacterium]